MPSDIDKCLEHLEALPAEKLHQTNCKLRSDLGCTEWRLAIALLASQRKGVPGRFDCSSLAEYADKILELAPQKANELASTARAMENLPALSEAFRAGRLSWTKVRALKRVVTPETEEMWVEFALEHSSREVERRVVQSPTGWKRSQALEASLNDRPTAGPDQVQQLLLKPSQPVEVQAIRMESQTHAGSEANAESQDEPEPLSHARTELAELPGPKFVRLTIDLTPDQYALYQAAEERVWAKEGRKVARAEVLMEFCGLELDRGSSRERARHQVIIHANAEGRAWYETDRGPLPVGAEVLEQALKGRPALVEVPEGDPGSGATEGSTYARKSRKSVPNGVARAAHARAGSRCEKCGGRGPLHFHHRKPVCDGGDNSLDNGQLLCVPCHAQRHRADFEQRPEWVRARARRLNDRSSN